MCKLRYTAIILSLVVFCSVLAACGEESAQGTAQSRKPTPTFTSAPLPTNTPEPTRTTVPTSTPFPTPVEEAPEKTFTSVGNVAQLNGRHGVSGKAIVAGLQTLIIQSFTFDGKGPKADIRLVRGQDYADPAAVLLELEPRPYEEEFLRLIIPSSVSRKDADSIAVYCEEMGEVYAASKFH